MRASTRLDQQVARTSHVVQSQQQMLNKMQGCLINSFLLALENERLSYIQEGVFEDMY